MSKPDAIDTILRACWTISCHDCEIDGCTCYDIQRAKTAILDWVELEIIGEDEPESLLKSTPVRNKLRAEQRRKLRGGEDNG